jgi:hypothetical protein
MAIGFASSELIALVLESIFYGTVPPLPPSSMLSVPHSVLTAPRLSPFVFPISRHVLCPVRRVRQGPLPQAKANGGWEPPPDPGLGLPFHPHNLGWFLTICLWDIRSLIRPSRTTAPNRRCNSSLLRLPKERVSRGRGPILQQGHSGAQYHENVHLSRRDSRVRYVHRKSIVGLFLWSLYRSRTRLQLYRCYIVWNASLAVLAFPVLLYVADIGMPPLVLFPARTNADPTFTSNGHRGSIHTIARRDERCLQQPSTENLQLILLLHSRFECCLHRCVFVRRTGRGDVEFDIPFQVSLHTASGAPSSRHARPRWAPPTLQKSPSSSLNLVRFMFPLPLRPQQSYIYRNATGAIYLTVLASEVAAFAVGSYMFNIFLDIVSHTYSLPF